MRHSGISAAGCGTLAVKTRAPAFRPTREHVSVMEQAIEHGRDGGGVAEKFAPVLDRPVRGQQRGGALVAPHDDLEEILARGVRELAHPEIVDDEQRNGRDRGDVVLARAGELRVGEVFKKHVRLPIQDAVALLDDSEAEGLGQMALPRAGRNGHMLRSFNAPSPSTTAGILSSATR